MIYHFNQVSGESVRNRLFEFLHFLQSYKVLFLNKIKLFSSNKPQKNVGTSVGTVGSVGSVGM